MPAKTLSADTWLKSLSRCLWNGPPLSGKTTGTLTLPRRSLSGVLGREVKGDLHLVVVPGELGYSSVLPADDYHIHAWEFDSNATTLVFKELWAELNAVVLEILTGKKGEVSTLVFDGLHKLYDLIMRVEGWSPAMVDDKESGKQYVKYHALFNNFMSRALGSSIPFVGATCYDGLEPIEPNSKVTQVMPMLPGQMAKLVLGMFPVTFHTSQEAGRYYWALRPTGKMQAAGLHVPAQIARRFPDRIEVTVGPDGTVSGGWFEIEKIVQRAVGGQG